MAREALTSSNLAGVLKDLLADVSDLVAKEFRLARAEIGEKVSAGMQAGLWMAIAAIAAVVASFLLVQAIVFGIASLGIALHWACLIVAAALVAIAAASFFYGRAKSRVSLLPDRTLNQIEKDIRVVRSN